MKPLAVPVRYTVHDGLTQKPQNKKSACLMQTSGLFYDSIGLYPNLLMLFTQQIVHGLYRIERAQWYFYEHRVPVAHGTVPQAW